MTFQLNCAYVFAEEGRILAGGSFQWFLISLSIKNNYINHFNGAKKSSKLWKIRFCKIAHKNANAVFSSQVEHLEI
jgi:hypothetical protein